MRPGGLATRRRMESAVTLLPQPEFAHDAQRLAAASPHRTRRRPPAPTPPAVKKWVWRSSICRTVGAGATAGVTDGPRPRLARIQASDSQSFDRVTFGLRGRRPSHQSTQCSVRKRPNGRKRDARPRVQAFPRKPPRVRQGRRRHGGGSLRPCPGISPWRRACPTSSTARSSSSRRPSPTRSRGGVLRYGITMRPPHFDFHQSGTINSLGSQGCMFDNLIRRDPRDSGKTIIPDLAHSWEIAKDGKTYTFHLRKDVQFHDGAELTSEDVKATFDRIAKPPAGVSIPRSILFASVSEITAPRQVHRAVQARRAAAGHLHHVGDRQRLERHRAQEDAGGQPVQPAPRRRHPRHRPVQEQAPRRERSLGDGEERRTTGTRACPISTASSSITPCRSRPSWARRSCPAASTTPASSIR